MTSDLIAPLPSLKEIRLDGNDISIVAKNAMDGANEIHSLSLLDNPLSCDCSLKSFAEWLLQSNISSIDLLGAVCATPPQLEGAQLLQILTESFKCDELDYLASDIDNKNVIDQLNSISKENNNNFDIKDSNELITLCDLEYNRYSELVLLWNIQMKATEYSCDAVFVYREENIHEILLDNSPVGLNKILIYLIF